MLGFFAAYHLNAWQGAQRISDLYTKLLRGLPTGKKCELLKLCHLPN